MADKQPQRHQLTGARLAESIKARLPKSRRGGLLPTSLPQKTLRWVDIDTISQTLYATYPLLDPDTIKTRDLLTLVVNLRFFGDTSTPPNALYLDMIREAWLEQTTDDGQRTTEGMG